MNVKIEYTSPPSPGFPSGSVVKDPSAHAGDPGLIPGLGRSPGGGNGNPPQYFCLENSTDRGAWKTTVHGLAKSQTRLSHPAGAYTLPTHPPFRGNFCKLISESMVVHLTFRSAPVHYALQLPDSCLRLRMSAVDFPVEWSLPP